jgi:hypothetical protein
VLAYYCWKLNYFETKIIRHPKNHLYFYVYPHQLLTTLKSRPYFSILYEFWLVTALYSHLKFNQIPIQHSLYDQLKPDHSPCIQDMPLHPIKKTYMNCNFYMNIFYLFIHRLLHHHWTSFNLRNPDKIHLKLRNLNCLDSSLIHHLDQHHHH